MKQFYTKIMQSSKGKALNFINKMKTLPERKNVELINKSNKFERLLI